MNVMIEDITRLTHDFRCDAVIFTCRDLLSPGGVPLVLVLSSVVWPACSRNIPDLVNKQGAAVGCFEQAGIVPAAPVNDPFACPKSSLSGSVAMTALQLTARERPGGSYGLLMAHLHNHLIAYPRRAVLQ